MIHILQDQGYFTSFYYGSSLDFANMRSYLVTSGFEKIVGQEDFAFDKKTKWGAYDEELFRYFIEDTENLTEPFVSMLLTLTSHEPYDAKIEHVFPHQGLPNKFRNTVYYADKCLGEFIKKAKEQTWYKNTLFIFLADHSHSLPRQHQFNEPARHRIPFMMYGEVLKESLRGKKISTFASQIDIPVTILNQLDISYSGFFWSKDLFNPAQNHFAYYTFNEGFGYITPEQTVVWDQNLEEVIFIKNPEMGETEIEMLLTQGKAILQVMMEQFINENYKASSNY
jgi:phosphoglycerol transferase MdoB-like AlkP superfamily enzyme